MTQSHPASSRRDRPADGEGTFIVTGASGFVGRHLVERLSSLGHRVHALSQSNGFDVRTGELPDGPIDHVFHLAARTGVAEAWQDPSGFFEVNALGTFRVLDQCRRRGYPACYLSSFLYGGDASAGAKETDVIKPDNPYAFSKYIGEQICGFFGSHFSSNVVVLRPANIYGPGQGSNFLIPHVIAQLVDEHAGEILVQDLAPRRDYIHVDDVVDGMLQSMKAPAGSIFNLGSGSAYSVEEIIRCACRLAGVQKPYRAIGKPRQHEIANSRMDATAARQILGWEPKVSIERGLQSVIESMR
ncbi:MAG TPA: NAD(P)-dependent oxidoreductase [Xanthobacteraceae bacterium]|jgi:nucleoside-diphosphate-sugar epimerase|nr:NAD(P)-dependent oxidoreductase [Xanthobacteraceae bacterium]